MSYILPQVLVFQDFRTLPSEAVRNLNAFVFGPNYQLMRYAVPAEKAISGLGLYDGASASFEWPSLAAGAVVDMSSVKLFLDGVVAKYADIPASESAPVHVKTATDRNKLRAAPVIGDAANVDPDTVVVSSVDDDGNTYRGSYTGTAALPETYYFHPSGGATGGAWSADLRTSDMADQPSKFAYVTSEGATGLVTIPASATPLASGVAIDGPDGLKLNFDTGAGTETTATAPLVATIADSAGTSYFTISPRSDVTISSIVAALDSDNPLTLEVNLGVTPGENGYANVGNAFEVTCITGATLAEIRAMLVAALPESPAEGDLAFTDRFSVSAITGTATQVANSIEDQEETTLDGVEASVFPTAFRIQVTPSQYVFAANAASDPSPHFESRGVMVGDRVKWAAVVSGVEVAGESRVTGFEADQVAPAASAPLPSASNTDTQTATDIASGDAAAVVPGGDNMNDMSGAGTKLHPLSGSLTAYPGELTSGAVSDVYTILVTRTGLKGVALATVANQSGTYYRANVPIEVGGVDGVIYIGRNMKVQFQSGTSNKTFYAGDIYTVTVDAAFVAVSAETSGTYTGPANTVYEIEVLRGGVFTRSATPVAGIASAGTMAVSVDNWTGGDRDDEYIVKCIHAGNVANAVFSVSSLNNDNAASLVFGTTGSYARVGSRGLEAKFDAEATFTVGDYWVVMVHCSRPLVRISDSAGVDNGTTAVVTSATEISLGEYELKITFPANANTQAGFNTGGGLLAGDVFHISASAASDGPIRTLVLSDDLPATVTAAVTSAGVSNTDPIEVAVSLFLNATGIEVDRRDFDSPPDYVWEADADTIAVTGNLKVTDPSFTDGDGDPIRIPVERADMYVEYRALLPTYSTALGAITSTVDVPATLGTIDPANPLALGVYNALLNSGGRAVYFMATPTDDLEGYLSVLDRASLSEDVYGLAPVTRDRAIIDAVQGHINSMSTETDKRWRIGFVGTALDTVAPVYTGSTHPDVQAFYCTISLDQAVPARGNVILDFVNADGTASTDTAAVADVKAGDTVRTGFSTDAWGEQSYSSYTVAAVLSNTRVRLRSGTASPVAVPARVEVLHPLSTQELAESVASTSASFASRRMYHVFPDTLTGSNGIRQTSEFAAAAVAGLCSSVPPQQGLTNIELVGFSDLPRVYSTFSSVQLNRMAEYGTLILMQDTPGGKVYVRHQLSTKASSGDLNQTELSVTKNVDSISYYFAGRFAPYIGRYNVTPDLIRTIDAQLQDGINFLGSYTAVGLLGPQLLLDAPDGGPGTSIRTVAQHPVLRDRIVAAINLLIPYPLNVIELHLEI
jgi:hypothetical protein